MLLPTKGIDAERALLTIGADVLNILKRPMTVSEIWDGFKAALDRSVHTAISFDWFAVALTMLYSMHSISLREDGLLERTHVSA